MISRGAFTGQRSPGPFHCLACRTYVTGTDSGHCPRCGWVPPHAPEVPEPAVRSPVALVVVLLLVLVFALVVYQ